MHRTSGDPGVNHLFGWRSLSKLYSSLNCLQSWMKIRRPLEMSRPEAMIKDPDAELPSCVEGLSSAITNNEEANLEWSGIASVSSSHHDISEWIAYYSPNETSSPPSAEGSLESGDRDPEFSFNEDCELDADRAGHRDVPRKRGCYDFSLVAWS